MLASASVIGPECRKGALTSLLAEWCSYDARHGNRAGSAASRPGGVRQVECGGADVTS